MRLVTRFREPKELTKPANLFTMKKNLLLTLCLSVVAVFSWQQVQSQCTIGTGSNTYYGSYYPGCGSFNQTPTSFGPGQYLLMPTRSGGSYTISTCGNGSWQGYDTQITVRRTNNVYLGYDDDATECGGMTLNSWLNLTGTVNENVRVGVKRWNCQPNSGGSSSIYVRLRQNNNLSFATGSACEGDAISLGATPARSGTNNTGSHNW